MGVTLSELYPWLKALHVAAALIFFGGVLTVSVLLAAMPANPVGVTSIISAVRRWDRRVTSPAMLLIWVFGLTLATTGHRFSEAWLQIKLVLVLFLSGLHGYQSGRLRLLARGIETRSLLAAPIVIGCAVLIALLAVVKPL